MPRTSAPDTHEAASRLEDMATQRVPEEHTVSGWHIALILVGIVITIPAFLTGAELGLALGVKGISVAIPVGALTLCLIGCLTATVAVQSRLTTYMIIRRAFGFSGARLVNLVMSVSLFGWFTVTARFFGHSIHQGVMGTLGVDLGRTVPVILGCVLVAATVIFGFRAIEKLTLWTVPLLLAIIGWLIFIALSGSDAGPASPAKPQSMNVGQGITAVVGGFIVGAIILPDFCRFARNLRHGLLVAITLFGIAYPLVLGSLAVVAIESGEKNFILLLTGMGHGALALVVLVLATWTTNAGNLYSNALVLKTLLERVPQWKLVMAAGGLGALIALTDLPEHLIGFLVILGISIPPIAGIYVADALIFRRDQPDVNLIQNLSPPTSQILLVWLLGSTLGFATNAGWMTLTKIPAFDAMLTSFAVHLLVCQFHARKGNTPLDSSVE